MPLLIGTAVPPPVVAAQSNWHQMGVKWTGPNGQVFDLADLSSGIILSRGVRGLGMPPVTAYTADSPALAGARFMGSQVGPRSVLWPLFIWSDTSSAEFLARDRAFWQTMDPDNPGTWSITGPDGKTRRLQCQYTDDGGQTFDVDPMLYGWSLYGITLTAYDEPYWQGDPVEQSFKAPANSAFYLTTGGVIHISPGNTTDTASIPNPGDVDAWPIWTVTGPYATAHLGAGGGAVDVPFAQTAGQYLIVDTRPDHMTATDQSGTDRSGDVVWAPAAVPSGATVELDLSLTSTTSATAVDVQITPRYRRAW